MTSPTSISSVGTGTVTTTSPGMIPGSMLPVSMVAVRYPNRCGPTAISRKATTHSPSIPLATRTSALRGSDRRTAAAGCTTVVLLMAAPGDGGDGADGADASERRGG